MSPGPLAGAVERRLRAMGEARVVERAWARDHTVWKPDPTEITDRLDWLTVAEEMGGHLAAVQAFAHEVVAEGFRDVVLLGMGGSSLAPEVFRAVIGRADGFPELHVLDSTHPGQIAAVERDVDPQRTLFLVASKSGGTIETRSHFEYFWAKHPDGARFAVVTDGGSPLEGLARERGVRRVFRNPPGIGGRYSALSFFGLVPAALVGVDCGRILEGARSMMAACRGAAGPANPGACLGAVMGEAALAGRDKLTLVLPPGLAALGPWVEQLVAESTGKEGLGILPVEGEPLLGPDAYGDDRLFVAYGAHAGLETLRAAGHPVVTLPWSDRYELGGEFFRWEFATAIAGHVLGIQPFDQPDVQAAKDATARVLAGERVGAEGRPLAEVLASVRPGDYIAITAYLPRDRETADALAEVREALLRRYGVATTVGFGPRFLHSTGQLHKGGPNTGIIIQVVASPAADIPIPDQAYTFGRLLQAQALGDLARLVAKGRRVARVSLDELRSAVV